MHTVLKLAQLRWTGHIKRVPDERLPKKVFYGILQEGKVPVGNDHENAKSEEEPMLEKTKFTIRYLYHENISYAE